MYIYVCMLNIQSTPDVILPQLELVTMRVGSVLGNGDCFFHSVSAQINIERYLPIYLGLENTVTSDGLRQVVAQGIQTLSAVQMEYMIKNLAPEDLPRLMNGTVDMSEYARRVGLSGAYVGLDVVYVMSRVLGRPITVYNEMGTLIFNGGIGNLDIQTSPPIPVRFSVPSHWHGPNPSDNGHFQPILSPTTFIEGYGATPTSLSNESNTQVFSLSI